MKTRIQKIRHLVGCSLDAALCENKDYDRIECLCCMKEKMNKISDIADSLFWDCSKLNSELSREEK